LTYENDTNNNLVVKTKQLVLEPLMRVLELIAIWFLDKLMEQKEPLNLIRNLKLLLV